ncbi:polymorphic toxin-type HINT domain-containing protein [Tuwongella immobilis]|uniref:Intein C-terminal splicing domain-containing protein n=1 Tax=Tuwongella immobilis TaxID=692036 RepID=A0A6C2YJU2_9BACT|nr:polymorphic toxin-type HINT domain-containing protein [Tuwongella immobilis]VIP01647.1 intein c-terminal splicing region domain protein : YD repeat protein OS=Isosphaera pallida (strain ATCC 43644 / DSM 9630 / IS1B) GN=Isop_2419 PE=4 SV=1: PT-HINT [Tuwongella immobilis]VTR99029.1 intein c-terminal splicing region domain protein : YD repeat protein OS=Isosphaera pallida (strain ATCC 43644 / DSM 9630 / IS1B) GN=Isop_2419 PE=4 SV=1: PT-HINT [Tuwongella immobilis]
MFAWLFWIEARSLTPGHRLRTLDGSVIAVESVAETGQWQPVYNLRVADWHTYFVGDDAWGWAVWAHNTCFNHNEADVAAVTRRAGLRLEQRDGKWVTIATNGRGQEVVRSATGKDDFVTVNGQIRVLRPGDPISTHTALADKGPVDYAGEIVFSGRHNRGQIRYWDNGSGHFQPKAVDAHKAGLPMNLFRPVRDRESGGIDGPSY